MFLNLLRRDRTEEILLQMSGEREERGSCSIRSNTVIERNAINPLKAELNPTCHLLALIGAHHILHVSGLRVKVKKRL